MGIFDFFKRNKNRESWTENNAEEMAVIDRYENKTLIYHPSKLLADKVFINKLIETYNENTEDAINRTILDYLIEERENHNSPIYHTNPDFLSKYAIYRMATLGLINRFERGNLTEYDIDALPLVSGGKVTAICKYVTDPFTGKDLSNELEIGKEYEVKFSIINHTNPVVCLNNNSLWNIYLFSFEQNGLPFDVISDPVNLFFIVKQIHESGKYETIMPFAYRFDHHSLPYDFFKEPYRLDKEGYEYEIYMFNFIVKYNDGEEDILDTKFYKTIIDYIYNRENIIQEVHEL